jgi:hypothetical protein
MVSILLHPPYFKEIASDAYWTADQVDFRVGLNNTTKIKICPSESSPSSQFTDFAILTHIQQHQYLFIYCLLISYLVMITDVARYL